MASRKTDENSGVNPAGVPFPKTVEDFIALTAKLRNTAPSEDNLQYVSRLVALLKTFRAREHFSNARYTFLATFLSLVVEFHGERLYQFTSIGTDGSFEVGVGHLDKVAPGVKARFTTKSAASVGYAGAVLMFLKHLKQCAWERLEYGVS